jgi:hypothetical protein
MPADTFCAHKGSLCSLSKLTADSRKNLLQPGLAQTQLVRLRECRPWLAAPLHPFVYGLFCARCRSAGAAAARLPVCG